jgi:hypothetical protein
MNTIAEFCELFCHHLDNNSKPKMSNFDVASAEPKTLTWLPPPPPPPPPPVVSCHTTDNDAALGNVVHVPLLVALHGGSDGETSDSSDTEDGSSSSSSSSSLLNEPDNLECAVMVVVVAPAVGTSTTTTTTTGIRRVSFDSVVAVREHAVTVGAGTSSTTTMMMVGPDELPLQLDWPHADTTFRSMATSKHRRAGDRGPPRLSLELRRERLKRVSRYTDQELDRIVTGSKAFSLLSYFNF